MRGSPAENFRPTSDLQNPAEETSKLLAMLVQGYGVVYGAPQRERHRFLCDRASQITKIALLSAMPTSQAGTATALRD